MKVLAGLIVALLFCKSGGVQAAPAMDPAECDEVLAFSAEAFRRGSDELLYREAHRQCRRKGLPVWGEIRYFQPSGDEFASKWLDYRAGAATPDFQLTDRRTGYSEGARRRGDRVVLNRRTDRNAAVEEGTVKRPANAVIDSGFDEYVRAHIDRLLRGETVRLKFLVAGDLDSFSFKVHRLEKVRLAGRDAYHMRVEHDSFLVRMLIDPILLWYDADTLRLMEYRGISNIHDPSGGRYDARIVYPQTGWKRLSPADPAPASNPADAN